MRPQGGLESNFACSASGGAFRGPKRLERYQPPEARHKHRLSLMQRVSIGMDRHLKTETAQGVQTGLHRCCSAKSCTVAFGAYWTARPSDYPRTTGCWAGRRLAKPGMFGTLASSDNLRPKVQSVCNVK